MATILSLEGMHFHAPHGYYAEEALTGNNFILHVWVTISGMSTTPEDDFRTTVNYETLYSLCQVEMRKPTPLIEDLAQRVMRRIYNFFSKRVSKVQVKLEKLNPPLGGRVEKAVVEMSMGGLKGGVADDGWDMGSLEMFDSGSGFGDDDEFPFDLLDFE